MTKSQGGSWWVPWGNRRREPGRGGKAGPDGPEEKRFHLVDASLSSAMVARYAQLWLRLSGFSDDRLAEVPETVELLVAQGWEPGAAGLVLRLRSWYTGSTYWLHDWDGTLASAEPWIDEVAALQAATVEGDRRHGPIPWD